MSRDRPKILKALKKALWETNRPSLNNGGHIDAMFLNGDGTFVIKGTWLTEELADALANRLRRVKRR